MSPSAAATGVGSPSSRAASREAAMSSSVFRCSAGSRGVVRVLGMFELLSDSRQLPGDTNVGILRGLVAACEQEYEQSAPPCVKYTRQPGPHGIRSSETPSPTGLRQPALPSDRRRSGHRSASWLGDPGGRRTTRHGGPSGGLRSCEYRLPRGASRLARGVGPRFPGPMR